MKKSDIGRVSYLQEFTHSKYIYPVHIHGKISEKMKDVNGMYKIYYRGIIEEFGSKEVRFSCISLQELNSIIYEKEFEELTIQVNYE
ncbi:MAG TPA: hypothetical protein PLG47_05730 [Candidatus Dojkabacteria bacterium]|nr:hypothetical protein [Candidatus Dojkabacteria bacterium]